MSRYRHGLVRALVLHFAELAGYEHPLYHVTQDRAAFERIRKRRGYTGIADPDADLGVTLSGPPAVSWVNPETNETIAQLAHTCAHEALHAARPELVHGRKFERLVRGMLRGREP